MEAKRYFFKGEQFAPYDESSKVPLTPYIGFEPSDGHLPILGDGLLHLEFKEDTPMEEMSQTVDFLNQYATVLVYTP